MKTLRPYQRLTDRFWATAQRPRSEYGLLVQQIRSLADEFARLTDERLAAKCQALRAEVIQGTPVTALHIVIPCFALVHEAARRATGLLFYDVQLFGGLALSTGAIADVVKK